MKKLCFYFLFFGILFTVSAQDDEASGSEKKPNSSSDQQVQTLLQNIQKISGFGAFDLEYAPIDGDIGVFTGGSGGIILGNIYLGGYGMGLSTSTKVDVNNQRSRLHFGHGGFLFGIDLMPKNLVHFTATTKLGWGSVRLAENNFNNTPDSWFGNRSESVFVIQPSAGIEVNMTKFFKIALTGQYRLVQGAKDLEGFDATKLSNASVGLSLKFGWFE